jgi:hypothetical protein
MNQVIRDLGDGVIEVTIEFSKWGGRQIDMVSAPWSAFRTEAVPYVAISDSTGGYTFSKQIFNESKPKKLTDTDLGGWIAYVQNMSKESHGIGIVYGKKSVLDGPTSFVRWGEYDSPELEGIDGTILSVKRDIDVDNGDRLRIKYYLIIGTLGMIQEKALTLVEKVEVTREKPTLELGGRIQICSDEKTAIRRGCLEGKSPQFLTFRNYVSGAIPLFILKDMSKNKLVITSNPYYISFNPTDKKTDYQNFLGWVVSEPPENDKEEKVQLSQVLSQSFPTVDLDPNDSNLFVLKQKNNLQESVTPIDIFLYNDLVKNYRKTGIPGWVKSDMDLNGTVDKRDHTLLLEMFQD